MKIYFIRHGKTPGNIKHKYIGSTDETLDPLHTDELNSFDKSVDIIFCSPMHRCIQTANILFPDRTLIINDNLRECDFGDFENRSADEMENDAPYRAWVDSGCTGQIPNGDIVEEFKERSCNAFVKIITDNANCENIAIVTHGGVIMSIMEKYAVPKREFYTYNIANGEYFTVTPKNLVDITLEIMK